MNISVFDNDQVSKKWRIAWELKEQALKSRYVKTLEQLNEHTRPLPPLEVGDRVYVQNQNGNFSTRWDRSGTILEANDFHQYRVKLDGSGRVSLRNRRFLRKFTPHSLAGERTADYTPAVPAYTPAVIPQRQSTPRTMSPPKPDQHQPDAESPSTDPSLNDTLGNTTSRTQPELLVQPSVPQSAESSAPRRSPRPRKTKLIYRPETGDYGEPNLGREM